MKRLGIISVFLTLFFPCGLAQEKQKNLILDGYLTTLESGMHIKAGSMPDTVFFDNIIHNRLNFKAFIGKNITFAAEIRNRLFTGDMSGMGTDLYSEMIGTDPGLADMSWNLKYNDEFFLNTTIDRVWLDLNFNKFQARIGRQRINWGQAFIWNPNDIFNTYSFFDFDYVERPGSDAIRLQYYPTSSSAAEIAVKMDDKNKITAAGLYRFNKWGYDIQLLAGVSNSTDILAGAGWSGSIGSVGFRGEGTWFRPSENFMDTTGTAIITAGIDKIFEDNSMLQVQLMYSNNPLKLNNFINFYSGTLSAKDLAYSEFTAFGQFTWAATPLMNIGISAMWFPDLKGYYAGPSFDYSMAENVDFSLFWQHFNALMAGMRTKLDLVFLRVKFSF